MDYVPPAIPAAVMEVVADDRAATDPRLVASASSHLQTRWVRLPSGDALQRAYPTLAWNRGVSGFAFLECTVAQGGVLEGCQVRSENPTGYGFGRAALSLRSEFRVDTASAAVGTSIRFRVDFSVPY